MKIRIDGLEVVAIVGVRERERDAPQPLFIDLEFRVPPPEADVIEAAVDYSAVIELVREHVRAGRYHLIETVAATTAERVADAFGLDDVRIRVAKPGASASARFVAVEHRLPGARRREERLGADG